MKDTETKIFKGYNGNLELGPSGVKITRGAKGFALQSGTLRGEKFVPYESIVGVQFRKANLAGVGYLQLSLRGGSENKAGLLDATQDENTVTWSNIRASKKNKEFQEANDLILSRITREPVEMKVCPDCAEEVRAAANVCRYCGHRFE
jgi:hypothetical protein